MNALQMQLNELEFQRAQNKLFLIIDKEVRGSLKSAFDAHPDGPEFESIRKRLVKRLTSKDFLDRIKPYLK